MTQNRETVVFVHGLYMTGLDMALLRRRVRRAGFETRQFHYHSVLTSVAENAAKLADYIAKLNAETLHLVGHSLGGLVILRMFEAGAPIPPGRVVLMGSPVRGSATARDLVERNLGWLLGRSGPNGLAEQYEPVWNPRRDLGVVIGTGGAGFGLPHRELMGANDGVVTAEETHLAGTTDYIEVKASHTGLLFNAEAARQVIAFLRAGAFQ
ncbi:MAG TPA: alpha/beta fold hydrolase [Gammaproteobacteria bacterium]|nr:alpha/beta fold hydrolase [Gammaproteobacteria bacterium]